MADKETNILRMAKQLEDVLSQSQQMDFYVSNKPGRPFMMKYPKFALKTDAPETIDMVSKLNIYKRRKFIKDKWCVSLQVDKNNILYVIINTTFISSKRLKYIFDVIKKEVIIYKSIYDHCCLYRIGFSFNRKTFDI